MVRSWLLIAWGLSWMATLAACRFQPDPHDKEGRRILRVGHMPNLTHAPALLGFETGLFSGVLGGEVVVQPVAFNAGPSVIEALFAGELDVAYVGPTPAINAHLRSRERAVRVVAGSTSGGASFVVQKEIASPMDLHGKKVASPQLANTQDVALRTWLVANGLGIRGQGGDVQVVPIAPSDILSLFQRKELAGAWVPEPWASRLVLEGGGKVLVDERQLWPGGAFPTTVVIASTVALRHRPDLIRRFLQAHEEAVSRLQTKPAESHPPVIARIARETGAALPGEVVERAWSELSFTVDPMAAQLERMAEEAKSLGYLPSTKGLESLVDTSWLRP